MITKPPRRRSVSGFDVPVFRLKGVRPKDADPRSDIPHPRRAKVRVGSLANILRCGSHVRFTPESGD